MRKEYDFSKGKRGVFLKHFPPGATLIALDEDVRKQSPTRAVVNKALRSLTKAKRTSPPPSSAKRNARDLSRAHFDFATGKRGAFLKRFPTGVTLVILDEDVRTQFPTAAAANKALRALAKTKRARRS